PPSEQVERLRWFTGDWVRFDPIDDLLVMTDVRLGAAIGLSSFRFVVAEQNLNDEWTLVTPYRWPTSPSLHLLKPVMQRIYQSTPPLALQDWLKQAQMGATP